MTITTAPKKSISTDLATKEGCIKAATSASNNYREAMLLIVEAWVTKKFGSVNDLADAIGKSHSQMRMYAGELRKQGRLPQAINANKTKRRSTIASVENSEEHIEQVDVKVHEPVVAAAAVQRPFAPAETPAPVAVSAVKRPSKPKDLQMLDSQQRMVKERLLPLAKQLVELTEQVKEEKARLHGRWVKDNIVFATGFQRCVDYWNDCNYFTEFAEVFGDDRIKTYADVLATIEQRFKRNAEHLQAIQYATGCTPDPNKKDM